MVYKLYLHSVLWHLTVKGASITSNSSCALPKVNFEVSCFYLVSFHRWMNWAVINFSKVLPTLVNRSWERGQVHTCSVRIWCVWYSTVIELHLSSGIRQYCGSGGDRFRIQLVSKRPLGHLQLLYTAVEWLLSDISVWGVLMWHTCIERSMPNMVLCLP